MSMKILPINVFAFTELGSDMPAFISVNEASDGGLTASVRCRYADGTVHSAVIKLPRSAALDLGQAIVKHFSPPPAKES